MLPANTNTAKERLGLDAGANLSDGHARLPNPTPIVNVIDSMSDIFANASSRAQTEMETEFADALATVGKYSTAHLPILAYSASSLVITIGSAWKRRRSKILMVEPAFDNIRDLLLRLGLEVDYIHERSLPAISGETLMSYDALWLTTPNNPTGTEISEDEYRRLAERCADGGAAFVADHCFRCFSPNQLAWDNYKLLRSIPNLTWCGIEDTGKMLSLLDVKAGALYCSADLVGELRESNEDHLLNVSPFVLGLLTEALRAISRHDLLHTHLHRSISENRAVFLQNAEVNGSQFQDVSGPFAPFVWLMGSLADHGQKLEEEARVRGVHILSGESFYRPGSIEGKRFSRIALSRRKELVVAGACQLSSLLKAP